ncbi:MAG TPA: hypothetical protein VNJ29_03035 [Candidatus Nitrosotenuis sp.]|nr:hypothetical protein [Candidatus Nitrosotenuis sp.]
MTHKIDSLSKKLKELQGQQQTLESKLSIQLYQEIQALLGEHFSPSLALTLIRECWTNSHKSQEDWLKQAHSFLS